MKNINFNNRIERVLDIEHIFFKVIDSYDPAAGIYNPIFTYFSIFIVIKLADVIICWITGGK